MINKKDYSNGQKAQELNGNKLTYFFKNGKVKAEGLLINDKWKANGNFTGRRGNFGRLGILKTI